MQIFNNFDLDKKCAPMEEDNVEHIGHQCRQCRMWKRPADVPGSISTVEDVCSTQVHANLGFGVNNGALQEQQWIHVFVKFTITDKIITSYKMGRTFISSSGHS